MLAVALHLPGFLRLDRQHFCVRSQVRQPTIRRFARPPVITEYKMSTPGAKSWTNEQIEIFTKAATEAAIKAGSVISKAFDQPKNVQHKGQVDLVTETDKECEAIIFGSLKQCFPHHVYIGEEDTAARGSAPELTDEPTWMIDPIDGTTNFVHRYPFVCVSVALVTGRQPLIAVVLNPILGELYIARRGGGAKVNGQNIHVSNTQEAGAALMATELGTARDAATFAAVQSRFAKVAEATQSIRCGGSCALNMCAVASGRLDAMFEIGFGGCWDCAAGALMVTEAGGQVLDPAGGPFDIMSRRVLATNAHLGQKLAAVLSACPEGPREPKPPRTA